jgi:PAS domain S-box-containing protein
MRDQESEHEFGRRRQGESVLHETGSQFYSLLDKLPAAAYMCDTAGLITYFNQHAVQLWGRAPKLNDTVDRFCGSFKLFSADGTPIAHDQCWMAKALQTGKEFNGEEIVIERTDGSRVTALAHANPILDESGKPMGAVNILVDISDRKRAEQAQTLLAAIVESSDDAIISKTLDGCIRSWNTGAERLFGYTAHEAVGSPITLIIPPEKRDEEQSILAKLRSGERNEHFDTVRVSKQGRRIDISLTISPVRDGSGRIVGASKVARDITERKQAERTLVAVKDELAGQVADLRRLHEMSIRLSTTVELQPILDETVRTATAIEGANLGLLSLYEPGQNDLKTRASLGVSDKFLKAMQSVPPGGWPRDRCFRDQRRVVVEDIETDPVFAPCREAARQAGFRAVHCTPLITRSGTAVGVLSTYFRRPHRPSDKETHLVDLCVRQAVDFIENARLYSQLQEADRHKDEFLVTLAHELRNPLAAVNNSLHLIRLSDDLSPTIQHVREIMDGQVNQLIRLVDDLLEVSRIRRGKIELRKESIELAGVIASAVETSRPLIAAAGHQLAISLPSEPMTLEADAVRLGQVIANLLNNAAKYTNRGGQIWLTARREGSHAVLSVRDTGLGIPADMLPRVFDMFAQVDRTLERAQGGLGIGLSLAKNLVQLHGGRIEAHSGGPGEGSEFVVRLPLSPNVPRAKAKKPESQSERTRLPARRILVVDDTQAAVYVLGKLLEKMGQQVRTARDATSALESVRVERPDVVISDIAMPDMNGYRLARRLRQEPGLNDVVLVALTAI